jgi:hypothetical protein
MIKLGIKDIGTHIVRFYPNIGNLSETRIRREVNFHGDKIISKNEYWDLLKLGEKVVHAERWYSYAMVDDNFGMFQYGNLFNRLLNCCIKGEYCISERGVIYPSDNMPYQNKEDLMPGEVMTEYKLVTFTPFNPFDLPGNVAFKFEIKDTEGFADFFNFEIIRDDKYIVYKPGDSQEDIKNFLTSHIEEVPENPFAPAQTI